MNRIILVLLVFVSITSNACDLCTFYIGIQPKDFKNSIGLRYRYRNFQEKIPITANSNNNNANGRITNNGNGVFHLEHESENTEQNYLFRETYNSYDLLINIAISKKFNLLASTNFSDNYIYKNDSLTENISGVGDLMLLGSYRVFYTKVSADSLAKNKFLHRVTIGAGIELPTGSFNKKSAKSYETTIMASSVINEPLMVLDEHIQPGTGSVNSIYRLEYLARYNQLGFSINVSYKLNGSNRNNFRFADRINNNNTVFYLAKINKKLALMPYTGTSFEYSSLDLRGSEYIADSGGNSLFLLNGVQCFFNNVSLDLGYFHPIREQLNGNQASNKSRFIGQLSLFF